MTIGAPTRSALEVEDAMLAFGMNGEPLPVEHGFPVRMLIPGLYGYVSACKWLTGIEATTFDAFDAYWVERDWAAEGPIKVASRIDTPALAAQLPRRPPRHRRRRLGADPRHRRGSRSGSTRRTGSRPSSPRRSTPTCGASGCCPTTSRPAGTDHRPRHRADGEVQTDDRADAVPVRRQRLALHPGGRRLTTLRPPGRPRLVPAPAATRLRTAPAAGAPPARDNAVARTGQGAPSP